MTLAGNLEKMRVEHASPVRYFLPVGGTDVALNPLLGKRISLRHTGKIHCINCGQATKNSFQQGYCYPCMQKLARCDLCILKPELCHYHKGTCREPEWGMKNCMIDHIVYLAVSSGLKVGITRHTQIPTRWIDQGAVAALPIARVASRYQSGLMEHALKKQFNDKTNWQAMLKNRTIDADPVAARDRILPELKSLLTEPAGSIITESQLYTFEYPVLSYPERIKSISFDKVPVVEGVLQGMKGQYLMFDTGVINIRKHSGYHVQFEH
jgi:hypothetical protein